MSSLCAPGVKSEFAWLTQGPNMLARPAPWQAKALDFPGVADPDKGTYVTFSKYHPCESTGDHLYRVLMTPIGPRLGAEIPEFDTGGTRVRDHAMDVRFDVPAKTVRITDHITVERSEGTLPGIVLRLNSIYSVLSVKQNGTAIPFKQSGGFIAIQSADSPRSEYDLSYKATITSGAEDYILPNQVGLTSYWYPHTGRLPATSTVRITVPRGWAAIGQGEFGGKTYDSTSSTFSYKNTLPICYFTLAAGKYTITTRKSGDITVSAYLLHPSSFRAATCIDTAIGALQWFSKNFSKYPYTHYAVVESGVYPAALECYSFTLVGQALLPLALVHEIAHTWWGGVVPNTYTRTLWNESFAEYSDGLYGRLNDKSGLHEFNAQVMCSPMFAPLMKQASLMTAHDAMNMAESVIGYGKGSLVLENLEWMLGSEKMLACMRKFIERHPKGEDAEWKDFIDAVVEVAGPEWTAYFTPWLTRTDLPGLTLSGVKSEKLGNKYVITGSVAQKEPAFWIRVPLHIDTAGGSRDESIYVRSASESFRIETTGKPVLVSLDPNHESLRAVSTKTPDPTVVRLK